MEKILEKLFDIKKIPTKFLFVACVTSGILLFSPVSFLQRLNILDFKKQYGQYIGVSFLISLAFLIVILFSFFFKTLRQKFLFQKLQKQIIQNINNLDLHEKALLREFVLNQKSTLQLPFDNETVTGLVNKRIIYTVSVNGFVYLDGSYFNYSLTKLADQYLTLAHLDLSEKPTEEEKIKIWNERPDWAKTKDRIRNTRW